MRRVTFRLARRSDLPALEWGGEFAHFRRLYAEAYQQVELGDAIIWVAELPAGDLIAQLFVQLNSQRKELADGFDRAYIYGFRVRPAYRNLGLGTRLMQLVEADLRRRGYRGVTLNVGQDNPQARRLYERLGYQVIAPDPGRWSFIDHEGRHRQVDEPAWRMQKRLRNDGQPG